jgi:hypothetical protein
MILRAGFSTIGLAAGYALYSRRDSEAPARIAQKPVAPLTIGSAIATAPRTQPAQESPEVRIARVYQESIVPAIAAFELRNGAAVGRAVGMLHDRVDARRRRVPRFTQDVVSWGTRFGILKRYPSDLWQKVSGNGSASGKVKTYINEKFRDDILSEIGLHQDVVAVVAQYNEDITASRNELYSELELPLLQIKVIRPAEDISIDRLAEETRNRARELSGGVASQSVAAGLVEFSGGWLAMDAGQAVAARVVGQILARVGTAMATEGIAAGGATVEAAAAGSGTGSFGGPLGTIIGLGAGLIIGVIVDWRLSKTFESKISAQCNRFLDTLERNLRDGTTPGAGIRGTLLESTRLTNEAQAQAVRNALKQSQ